MRIDGRPADLSFLRDTAIFSYGVRPSATVPLVDWSTGSMRYKDGNHAHVLSQGSFSAVVVDV